MASAGGLAGIDISSIARGVNDMTEGPSDRVHTCVGHAPQAAPTRRERPGSAGTRVRADPCLGRRFDAQHGGGRPRQVPGSGMTFQFDLAVTPTVHRHRWRCHRAEARLPFGWGKSRRRDLPEIKSGMGHIFIGKVMWAPCLDVARPCEDSWGTTPASRVTAFDCIQLASSFRSPRRQGNPFPRPAPDLGVQPGGALTRRVPTIAHRVYAMKWGDRPP